WARQPGRHADRRDAARHRREPDVDILRPFLGAGGVVRAAAADAGVPAVRHHGTIDGRPIMNSVVRSTRFLLASVAIAAVVCAAARMAGNDYIFFAGYTVLQFIVLATAWNILGGLTGYVNFGAAAFFACGAYATVYFHKTYPLPIPVLVAIGAVVSGLV